MTDSPILHLKRMVSFITRKFLSGKINPIHGDDFICRVFFEMLNIKFFPLSVYKVLILRKGYTTIFFLSLKLGIFLFPSEKLDVMFHQIIFV